jgi:hypothetical protein
MGGDGDSGGTVQADTDGEPEASADSFEFESYYDLLGVPADASREEIQRAYREIAREHHPDVSNRPETEAERRFRRLLTARDVLTNAERRRAYDELGHEEYRRQSSDLGEPVGRSGDDGEPEPRPEPDEDDGRVQRSARGEAARRGDPVVTDTTAAFGPTTPTGRTAAERGEAPGGGTQPSTGAGDDIYRLTTSETPSSRSLGFVATRWARSWRRRVLVGPGSVLLAAGVLAALPPVLDAVGVAASTPAPTPGLLYVVGLAVTVGHTAYVCGTAEARLPRGAFLADRDHGRFATGWARGSRRRGVVGIGVAFVLALAAGRTGTRPWAHAADAVRGDLSGPFPWFDAPAAAWTTGLDLFLTAMFVLAAVAGTALAALGVSIALWRGRYERGLRLHPAVWEPVPAVTLLSLAVALVAGPVDLVSVPVLSALPAPVAAATGIEGSTVTVATAAVAGLGLVFLSVPLLGARIALSSARQASGAETE